MRTIARTAIVLGVALGSLVWCGFAAAQTITCPPAPNQVAVTVTPTVTFDQTSGLYTFSYTVANGPAAQLEVDAFALDIYPPISNVARPSHWYESVNPSYVSWDATDSVPLAPGEVDDGSVPPGLNQIKPGTSLSGFSFKSANPPGTVTFYASGYVHIAPFPAGVDADLIADTCPQSFGSGFDVAFKGTTQGPVSAAGAPLISDLSLIQVGDSFNINGSAFTARSVVNVFIGTAAGVVNVGPLTPSAVTTTKLTVPVAATTSQGQGVAAVQVVAPDKNFLASNTEVTLLEGSAAAGLPTVDSINGMPPSITTLHLGVDLVNMETVVVQGT